MRSEGFEELVRRRQSIRRFKTERVGQDLLSRVLVAAQQAPSAGNLQAYRIYLVRDKEERAVLTRAALEQEFVGEAPVVLVFCADTGRSAEVYGERGRSLYALQDATIAAAYAQLAATEIGLASCWVGAFDERKVWTALNLPQGLRPIVLMPIGYPDERPERTSRRPLKSLVSEKP